MQKETKVVGSKRLYTSVFDYEGTIFVNQFYVISNDLDVVLSNWSRLVQRKVITNNRVRKLLREELEDEWNWLTAVKESKNVWCSFFLFNTSYLESLVVVKTDQQVLGGTSREKYAAWRQYELYRIKYEGLKNVIIKTKAESKKRRKSERLMHYWEEKKNVASTHQGDQQGRYTIVMEYNGDVYIYQFCISPGENLNSILKMWSITLREHAAFREDEEDYVLVEQKVQQEVYNLVPVEGLINVWSTYFMLRDGLGNIYVIKTDEEITPGG